MRQCNLSIIDACLEGSAVLHWLSLSSFHVYAILQVGGESLPHNSKHRKSCTFFVKKPVFQIWSLVHLQVPVKVMPLQPATAFT